jgi:phage gp36-like protein
MPDSIEEYCCDISTLAYLYIKLHEAEQDNSHYTKYIKILEHDLKTANGTIRLLQALLTHTSIAR